jgi:hypothetical protein
VAASDLDGRSADHSTTHGQAAVWKASVKSDPPVTVRGTRTRALVKREVGKVKEEQAKSEWRFRLTQHALAVDGPLRVKLESIEKATENGALPGPVPDSATIWRWLQKSTAGARNIEDFAARKAPGRACVEIHPAVRTFLVQQVALQATPFASQVHKAVAKFTVSPGDIASLVRPRPSISAKQNGVRRRHGIERRNPSLYVRRVLQNHSKSLCKTCP